MCYRFLLGIENQLKVYARYMNEIEAWSLNMRLQQEYLVKKRFEELNTYRKNGMMKVHDTIKFNLLQYTMVADGKF